MEKYIKVSDLLEFANNQVDKKISANDFMRMNHVEFEPVTHAAWVPIGDGNAYCWRCTVQKPETRHMLYCYGCGAKMDGEIPDIIKNAKLDPEYFYDEHEFYKELHQEQMEQQ